MRLHLRLSCQAGKALPEAKPNSFADVLGSIPTAYKKADRLEVPAKFMAQIGADPSAKGSDKGHVEALFTELPKDITAALIKKCAASTPFCCAKLPTVATFPPPPVSPSSRPGPALNARGASSGSIWLQLWLCKPRPEVNSTTLPPRP